MRDDDRKKVVHDLIREFARQWYSRGYDLTSTLAVAGIVASAMQMWARGEYRIAEEIIVESNEMLDEWQRTRIELEIERLE